MRRAAGALLLCWPLALSAQKPGAAEVARAESLETAGRPWHAAEAFVGAGTAAAPASAQLLIANARAELTARRYARVVALLNQRPLARRLRVAGSDSPSSPKPKIDWGVPRTRPVTTSAPGASPPEAARRCSRSAPR